MAPMPVPEPEGSPPRPLSAAEARAQVEASRDARRAERERRFRQAYGDDVPGGAIRLSSWLATALLAGVSVVALFSEGALGAYFVVTFAMFTAGALVLALDVVLAVARSTTDSMGMGGLFFAIESAPLVVARSLNASLAVAVVVSVLTALVGLDTPELTFGTLAPLLQLALSGLWGVRHGSFPKRTDVAPESDANR